MWAPATDTCGMASTPAQFAVRARSFASELPHVERKAANAAALMVKNTALAELRQAVGADLRMSGVGKRGTKVGVRYDQAANSNTVLIRATGPVHLIERDTRPHDIPKARRRRGAQKVVSIPGIGVRDHVRHPGTKGKRPWGRALDRAVPRVPAVFAAETSKAMRNAFGR